MPKCEIDINVIKDEIKVSEVDVDGTLSQIVAELLSLIRTIYHITREHDLDMAEIYKATMLSLDDQLFADEEATDDK